MGYPILLFEQFIINEATSANVTQIQTALKSKYGSLLGTSGPNKDGVDGVMGPNTISAIKKFQEDNGIKPTGFVGPVTAPKLGVQPMNYTGSQTKSVPTKPVASKQQLTPLDLTPKSQTQQTDTFSPYAKPGGSLNLPKIQQDLTRATTVYKIGSEGPEVTKIQQKLIDLGKLVVSQPTGKFQGKTQAAVKEFQKSAGLPITGIVDTATYSKLFATQAPAQVAKTDTTGKTQPATNQEKGKATANQVAGTDQVLNPNASLLFDGTQVQWLVNGTPIKSWHAISGLTILNASPTDWPQMIKRFTTNSEEWSKDKNAGPIPPGKYTIGKIETRTGDKSEIGKLEAFWDFVLGKTTAKTEAEKDFQAGSLYSKIGWGNFRAPIIKQQSTQTHGRGGFYIHGGSLPGSHGCIDLTDKMDDFAKFYGTWLAANKKQGISLTVNYSEPTANAQISKLWNDTSNISVDQTQTV